jgi:hypothetical protein
MSEPRAVAGACALAVVDEGVGGGDDGPYPGQLVEEGRRRE